MINMIRKIRNSKKFWSRVNITGNEDCWNWVGPMNKLGYGMARLPGPGSQTSAHRVAWIYSFGIIENSDVDVLHKCANRSCVNPSHLYLGTHKENMREAVRRKDYLYPSLTGDEIEKAMIKARADNIRYSLETTGLDNISDIKIIDLIKSVGENKIQMSAKIMLCGHSERYIVQSNEGTSFCLMCAFQEADNFVRVVKGAIEKIV
jgi:hypothetical protein